MYYRCQKTIEDLSDIPERDDKYDDDDDDDIDCDYKVEGNVKSAEKLSETLTSMNCSPLKKIEKDRKVGYGKRKFKEPKDQLGSFFSDVIPGLDDLSICNDCDVLMRQVKEKLDKCHTKEERIQLLTLIQNIGLEKEQFPFLMSLNATARNIKKGILGIPDSVHRYGLSGDL